MKILERPPKLNKLKLFIILIFLIFSGISIFLSLNYLKINDLIINYKEKKYLETKEFKIGLVTDLHVKRRSEKNNYELEPEMNDFIFKFTDKMNNHFVPDMVIENGDFIEGTRREGEKSEADWLKLESEFSKLEMPFFHVIGNHEYRGLTKDQWKKLSNNKNTFYTFDVDRMRVIVLDGEEKAPEFEMKNKQLVWLEEILKNTKNYKIIIFIHFPLPDYVYSKNAKRFSPEQAQTLREMFSKYSVDAVFSGHVEKLYYENIGGVNYYVLPGFKKSENKDVPWLECYYEIVIKNDQVKTKMYYKKNENETEYKELFIPSEDYYNIEK